MSDQSTIQGTIYTTSKKHKRHTSMPSAGSEPAIPSNKQPQTHAIDHTTIGISYIYYVKQHQTPDDSNHLQPNYDLYNFYRVKVRDEKQKNS
jgi:hypothetical protein